MPRQGDHNELLAKVAKRAERAQLHVLVIFNLIMFSVFYFNSCLMFNNINYCVEFRYDFVTYLPSLV